MPNIFLDSGAHSIYETILKKHFKGSKRKGTIDESYIDTEEFWKYVDDYAEFIKKNINLIDTYVNVDVIFNAEATWKVQKYMEKWHGLHPLPVFHPKEDFKWLDKYIEEYDYIGIGGLGQDFNKSQYFNFGDKVFSKVCDTPNRLPKVKVHGFAMTSPDLLIRWPFFSVDSTSWVMYGKYGIILVPRKEQGKFDYTKSPICVGVSRRSPKMSIDGIHFLSMPPKFQIAVQEYLEEKGFVIGDSRFKEVETDYMLQENENWCDRKRKPYVVEIITERGVCNSHKLRDHVNLMYFLDLERSFPQWPWPWKAKKLHRLC